MHAGVQHQTLPSMQEPDTCWSVVGARGKHKHGSSRQGSRSACTISLTSLPAFALACIGQYLDSRTGFSLAQTCHVCATEFAQLKVEFIQKAFSETVPVVTPAREFIHLPYGTQFDPVSLHVKWEKDPGSALRRIHKMSQWPELINQLWRQAWPKSLWSDLACDGLSEVWPVRLTTPYGHCQWESSLYIEIVIEIASEEPMCLPRSWLARCLLHAPAASLTHYLNAKALPGLSQQHRKIDISLRRPARRFLTQLVMYKTFDSHWLQLNDTWVGDEDDNTSSVDSTDEVISDDIYVKPNHMQKVAITGSWCQLLPDAGHSLWRARHQYSLQGLTEGDDIAVDLRDIAEHDKAGLCGLQVQWLSKPAFVDIKPFTCEIAEQTDRHFKRQVAKKHARDKSSKNTRLRCNGKAAISRVAKARHLCEDVYVRALLARQA